MSKVPTHTAYVVEEARKDGQKDFWHKIAPVWPHKDHDGLDVVIPPGISVSGRLVIRLNRDETPANAA